MGLFDTVFLDGVEYQTKDAHCVLDTYEVRNVAGVRRLFVQTFELREIPEDERSDAPHAPAFRREDTGWRECGDANGVLALSGPDPEAGSLLLFVRDGIVVGQRQLEERFADGGLSLGHGWPPTSEHDPVGTDSRVRVDVDAKLLERVHQQHDLSSAEVVGLALRRLLGEC